HVLHRPAEHERPPLVEEAHRLLLVLATQLAQRSAELGLDRFDQPVERAVQRWRADGGDHLAFPDERHVGRLAPIGVDELGADGVEHRLDRGEQCGRPVGRRLALLAAGHDRSSWPGAAGSATPAAVVVSADSAASAETWSATWVAPW